MVCFLLLKTILGRKVEYQPLYESSMNVVCSSDPIMVKGREMQPVENQEECEKSCSLNPDCRYYEFVQIVYEKLFGCKLFSSCETTVNTILFGRIYRKNG